MRRIITYLMILTLIVVSVNFQACDGNTTAYYVYAIGTWLLCLFFGDCGSVGSGMDNSQTVKFVPVGDNDGKTIFGTWKVSVDDYYYLQTFEEDGKFNVVQHNSEDGSILRTDPGKFYIDQDQLTLEMDNGAYSVVKFKIYDGQLEFSNWVEENENVDVQ